MLTNNTDTVLCASQSDKKKTAAATDGDDTLDSTDATANQYTRRQKSLSSAHSNNNGGINMQRARSYSSGVLQMKVDDTPSLTKQQLKAAKDSEPCAPLSALWALNKPDAIYIVIGLIGAITVGAMMPVQGIVMAYLQVRIPPICYQCIALAHKSYCEAWNTELLHNAAHKLPNAIIIKCASALSSHRFVTNGSCIRSALKQILTIHYLTLLQTLATSLYGILLHHVQNSFFLTDAEELRTTGNNWVCAFLGLAAASILGYMLLGWGFATAGERMTRRLRESAFEATSHMLSHNYIYENSTCIQALCALCENSTGALTTRLEEDANIMAQATGLELGHKVHIAMTLIIGIIIGLIVAWQVGLVAMAVVPLI
eukprot:7765-Heterococcus_DN1.PRE.3